MTALPGPYQGSSGDQRLWALATLTLLFLPGLLVGPVHETAAATLTSIGLPARPSTTIVYLNVIYQIVYLWLGRKLIIQQETVPYIAISILSIFAAAPQLLSMGDFTVDNIVHMLLSFIAATFAAVNLQRENRAAFLKTTCEVFFIYVAAGIAYWWFFLRETLVVSDGLAYARMGTTLIKSVSFGPFIPFMFATYVALSQKISRRADLGLTIAYAAICFSATIASGSRLGLWLMLILLAALPFYRLKGRHRTAISLFAPPSFAVGAALAIPYLMESRFVEFGSGGRTASWVAGVKYWSEQSLHKVIFGSGFGNVYPYASWLEGGMVQWGGGNLFSLGGTTSLVTPHNSYVWMIVEGGIALCMLMLLPLLIFIVRSIGSNVKHRTIYAIIIACAVAVSSTNDFLIDEVGGAQSIFWIIIVCNTLIIHGDRFYLKLGRAETDVA